MIGQGPNVRRRAGGLRVLLLGTALVTSLIGVAPAQPAFAASGDVGYQDGSYSGSAPTGREPQSKLWFNDGIWWASMYSSTAHAVDIHRLDWATQTWIDSGVRIDERSKSAADTLWDGSKLYVLTAISDQSLSCTPSTSGDLTIRMLRYSYDGGTKTYTIDSGFPVTLANAGVQAVAMAKDSTGVIWVTWGYPSGSHGNVFVTHSTSDTAHYATPFVLPLSGVTTMECADYSAIVAYNGSIGVMWSNQTESALYFGIHGDGVADTVWSRSTSLSGKGWADNHVNVKSLQADPSGQVFASTKTSLNGDKCPPSQKNSEQPLILLVYMDGTGAWQRRTFSTAQDCESRPLVLLDPDHRRLYMFATQPAPNSSYGSGGSIMYKQTSLDNPNFETGPGLPFIQLAANPKINNVSGTKQTVNGTSGIVVLAADDSTHHYVHNAISLGSTTPDTTITAGPSGSTNSTSATFNYSSTAANATFTCSLDNAAFTSCQPSGVTYTNLGAGSHTFAVASTDPVSTLTDPTPASRSWTIDLTPPDTIIDSGPSNPTTSTTASFTFHATEAGSTFACRLDGGAYAACVSGVSYSSLTSAPHTFAVRATDPAGNTDPSPASWTWTVNAPASAPDTTITGGPSGATSSTSASFTYSSTVANATFACSLDGAAASSCASTGITYTGLAEGAHTFTVASTDTVSTLTDPTPASRSWTVDLTPPGGGIVRQAVSTTVNATAATTVTISLPVGTVSGDVLVACLALNGGTVASGGVPAGWSPIAAVTSISNPHTYGYYRVAGASEPGSYTWTLGSSVAAGAGIARYSGVNSTTPLDTAAPVASGASASSGTVPGVTTASAGAMLVGCMAINSSNTGVTIASPAGMSEAWDIGGKRNELDDGLQASAGPSGDKTWTFSAGREWAGWLVALRPS